MSIRRIIGKYFYYLRDFYQDFKDNYGIWVNRYKNLIIFFLIMSFYIERIGF